MFRGLKQRKPVLFVLSPPQSLHEPPRLTVSQRRMRKRTLGSPSSGCTEAWQWLEFAPRTIDRIREEFLRGNS